MRIASGLLVLMASLAFAGCSANTEDASTDSESKVVAASAFEAKLYDEPNADPSDFCDRFTFLSVESRDGQFTATLENRVSGECEIAFLPDRRTYAVTPTTQCGSIVFQGQNGADTIRVQDHRTRICEDYRPAILEIDEIRGGHTQLLFGEPSKQPLADDAMSQVVDVKLYDEPRKDVAFSCDQYTKLVIGREGKRLVGTVRNELSESSSCRIYVEANERTYELTESDSCGSRVFQGQNGDRSLRVQDNRSRKCADLRPDVVEVTESMDDLTTDLFGTL